jgi:hypothetical protein
MPSVRCWSCEKVKGKRSCPARANALICSRCCGTKRQVEISCPADCPYLMGADPSWRSASQQKEEARFLAPFFALGEQNAAVLFFLHHLILTNPPLAQLEDKDLEDVLKTARRTMETKNKGVLYSHAPDSAQLEPLVQWLTGVLARRDEIVPPAPKASDADIVDVLEIMIRAVGAHSAHLEGKRQERYLETAQRVLSESLSRAPTFELPAELESGPAPTGIIAPP